MFIVQLISKSNNYIHYVTNTGTSTNIKNAYKFSDYSKAEKESNARKEKGGFFINIIIKKEKYKEEVIF